MFCKYFLLSPKLTSTQGMWVLLKSSIFVTFLSLKMLVTVIVIFPINQEHILHIKADFVTKWLELESIAILLLLDIYYLFIKFYSGLYFINSLYIYIYIFVLIAYFQAQLRDFFATFILCFYFNFVEFCPVLCWQIQSCSNFPPGRIVILNCMFYSCQLPLIFCWLRNIPVEPFLTPAQK